MYKQQEQQDTDSIMFKVDKSQQLTVQQQQKRMNQNMFNKDKVIIPAGQPRKVIYGNFQKQNRTVYQILQPYLWTMAENTGTFANYAGKGIYDAVKNGASWLYATFTTTVIPYASEQLPKLIFVIKNQHQKQKKYQSSESFQVIEVEEGQYNQLNKNKHKGKKRVIVPLDGKQDPNFVQFLRRENYVYDYSFQIDCQSDQEESESFMIPSAKFQVLHEKVKKNYERQYEKSKQMHVQDAEKQTENNGNVCYDTQYYANIMKFNEPKKCIKLKDGLVFQYEGKNSIEYDFLDNIERDHETQFGYLIRPQKVIKSEISSDDGSYSGETPVLTVEDNCVQKQKVVDNEKRIRVQIPAEKMNRKQEEYEEQQEREVQYA